MEAAEIELDLNTSPTLPRLGTAWPGQGGVFAGIGRGHDGAPDYALILATDPASIFKDVAWGKTGQDVPGAKSRHDSHGNTQAMADAGCKLAKLILALDIEGHTDFVLPSKADMDLLTANVPELFEEDWHWTSTQLSAHGAFVQDFQDGDSGWCYEGTEHQARAVRRIPLGRLAALPLADLGVVGA